MSQQVLIDANATLVEQLRIKEKQLEAKQRRIEYLEFILAQRYEATKKKYNPEQISRMCRLCYEVFLDAGLGVGFTETEFLGEFVKKWQFKSAHLPQRLRDLVKQGKLWRAKDEKKQVRFYLKLEEASA